MILVIAILMVSLVQRAGNTFFAGGQKSSIDFPFASVFFSGFTFYIQVQSYKAVTFI